MKRCSGTYDVDNDKIKALEQNMLVRYEMKIYGELITEGCESMNSIASWGVSLLNIVSRFSYM